MQTLFAFLLKYKFFFIFLVLELIAFSMIINHTFYQRYILINSANRLTGTLYTWNKGVSEYFTLKQTNQLLAEENARLRGMLQKSQYVNDTSLVEASVSLTRQQFTYIPAKVISNSINKRNNYIMINRGRRHGIDRDMAVISPEGAVGIVINVSENYAWVMSILNKNAKISGRIMKNNYQGFLSWDGGDYQIGTFSDVPSHVHIETGDTIVTSGFSLMFPMDIMIGTVKDYFIARDDHFYTLKLGFSVDFSRLSYVYVVNNLTREEKMSIIEPL